MRYRLLLSIAKANDFQFMNFLKEKNWAIIIYPKRLDGYIEYVLHEEAMLR